jgi:hypothetical protein
MNDKNFSPLPQIPPAQTQEEIDEQRHVASHNITEAVHAAHAGEGEESIAFSLIAISITLHAIWEMLNKKDTNISGKSDIDPIELARLWAASLDPNSPEKEETE